MKVSFFFGVAASEGNGNAYTDDGITSAAVPLYFQGEDEEDVGDDDDDDEDDEDEDDE